VLAFNRAVPAFNRAVPAFNRAVLAFNRVVPAFNRVVPAFFDAVWVFSALGGGSFPWVCIFLCASVRASSLNHLLLPLVVQTVLDGFR